MLRCHATTSLQDHHVPITTTATARNSAVHMAVAFIAMGSWATFANLAHPMPRPLIAGVVQGILSALITLFLKRIIEALSARLPGSAGYWVPPVVAVAVSLSLLSSIHWIAGTPEILRTIVVPLSVTAIYATSYNLALRRMAT